MTRAEEIWFAHQRKRFMRPDAHRYMRPQPYQPPCRSSVKQEDAQSLIEAERRELLALKAAVAELKFHLALRRFARKYRDNQPRDDHGRWVYDGGRRRPAGSTGVMLADAGSLSDSLMMSDASPDPILPGAQYAQTEITVQPGVLGRDPRTDTTTTKLTNMLASIMDTAALIPGVNEMSPQAYGRFVHRKFAEAVRAANLPGIGYDDVERTFGGVRYGAKGSVRTDVVLRNEEGKVIAIYDVKTGDARIEPSRAAQLRGKVGVGESVPVIEMSVERGVSRKHLQRSILTGS